MLDWNTNTIEVKGSVKDVLEFIKDNFNTVINPLDERECGYVLDFEKFLPTPRNEKGEVIDDWYNWRYKNWGCKWSPNFTQRIKLRLDYKELDKESLILTNEKDKQLLFNMENIDKLLGNEEEFEFIELSCSFETPWNPPYGMILKWFDYYEEKKKDIELTCSFYESATLFTGYIKFNTITGELEEQYYNNNPLNEVITFLLDEGFETIEYYLEEIQEMLDKVYDVRMSTRLYDKIKEVLTNETIDNINKSKLIAEVMESYQEGLIETKKVN